MSLAALIVVSTAIGIGAASGAQAVRIMPLGDSITRGNHDGNPSPGGYRTNLDTYLQAAGYSFDFVGSQLDGPPSLADKDHEGHPGFTISQLSAQIQSWLSVSRPDVVMLMIGTNDVLGNVDMGNAPSRLSSLIDQIEAFSPRPALVVASITPLANTRADPNRSARAQTYNAAIPGIVNQRAAAGEPVKFVDMYKSLTTSDLDDGIHPNSGGYGKMAVTWFNTLLTTLSPTAALPPPAPVASP